MTDLTPPQKGNNMNTVTDSTQADQKALGLYPKFQVIRTDGKGAPGEKHEHDEYFVLNLTTDKHALPAVSAYAKSCENDYPLLARDLRTIVRSHFSKLNEFVIVPETTLPGGLVVPSFLVGKYHAKKSDLNEVVITADGKPWKNINYHNAVEACKLAGLNLITESQYLAIAYQITQQDENWTGGKVGEGEVFRGIHKGDVDGAQDGHYESEEPTERRWHALANGEVVYDFSGNIYSWVFDELNGDDKGVVNRPFADDSPTKTTAPYPNREHGIGDTTTGRDWSGGALIRGGCWLSGDGAGVFLLGNGWPDDDRGSVGFRCTKSL